MDAATVDDYLRDTAGEEITAKDVRTWHATVLAAEALAGTEEPGESKASRRRAVLAAMTEVGEYLGNTPAITRSSYVDPRVVDVYEDGTTIARAVGRRYNNAEDRKAATERAVLRMLSEAPKAGSRAVRSR